MFKEISSYSFKIRLVLIGSALIAVSLAGSTRPRTFTASGHLSHAAAEIETRNREIIRLYSAGNYSEACTEFLALARDAERRGLTTEAIAAWNNAGGCSIASFHFRAALNELSRSRDLAERADDWDKVASASNNIASLYIQMGNFEAALRVATDAVSRRPPPASDIVARLDAQRAVALSNLRRLSEARPLFERSIARLDEVQLFDAEMRIRGVFGRQLIDAGEYAEAEFILTEALHLARIHRVGAANVLRSLALLRAAQGNERTAAILFQDALDEPPGPTPRWMISADRGEFRLAHHDLSGALDDFREARRLAAHMRADIVPADEDRVALETGLGRIAAGLVDARNQLALETGDLGGLRESFDVAEQDRQWSLRALVPEPDDWRTRLPSSYWDTLAHYQILQRSLAARPSSADAGRASALSLQLQIMEAKAGGNVQIGRALYSSRDLPSALESVQDVLDDDAVLFSFYLTKRRAWLWAITRTRFDVYPIGSTDCITGLANAFVDRLREGSPAAIDRGRELYFTLFSSVARGYLSRRRWFLELDGALYSVPFAALVTSQPGRPPHYAIESASIEAIPGALLLEPARARIEGAFVAIADAVYNGADARYRGKRIRSDMVLARLPNTDPEARSCARSWGGRRSRILTGMDAGSDAVESALESNPSIIHFAAHVVPAPGDYRSGLIALSLDRTGSLGLLGPREILARPVTADLVVLDGCHSAQASSLPSAGLMGLTRAWIGAGAHAVMATLWDIPDDAQSALPAFYQYLHAHQELGAAAALRAAQLEVLRSPAGHDHPVRWAGYFLLSRR